ncbi:MAG: hypothetical protein GY943_25280 [Chloroflexi bacterium]|nr:hypothetical protein [Chloroflexota bacterium]
MSADGALNLVSDDPDTAAANDPTVTPVSIIEIVYLPMVMNNFVSLPDLVINSLIVSSSNVTIEIENIGDAPTTDDFWVDFYIDPSPPPIGVNETWDLLSSQGMAWGVTQSLAVGETLTLTINDTYYDASKSNFSGIIPSDAQVYAQVDSANTLTTYGAVQETHEFYGVVYNNILSATAP